jgi:hypothetical protein
MTYGVPEGLFVEGGDQPQPGVQVQPWGPEHTGAPAGRPEQARSDI